MPSKHFYKCIQKIDERRIIYNGILFQNFSAYMQGNRKSVLSETTVENVLHKGRLLMQVSAIFLG
jgi:hypothetical protein